MLERRSCPSLASCHWNSPTVSLPWPLTSFAATSFFSRASVISLKQLKKEMRSVRMGQECGVILADYDGAAEGDTLTFYEMVPRKPSLYEKPTASDQAAGD